MGRSGLATTFLLLTASCAADIDASLETVTATAIDYSQAGEVAIENAMAGQFGVGVEAQCEEPVSTEPATTFECAGMTSGGTLVDFIATITRGDEVTIALGDIP